MLKMFKTSNHTTMHETLSKEKKQVTLTGTLTNVLRPGTCATYLYHGNLIRTSTVQAILEAAPEYVRFETRNSIYTIAYEPTPVGIKQSIA